MYEPDRVKRLERPHGLPFRIGKLGHVVLNVRNVERSARFYTEVLGFQISDVYPEEMVPGGMGSRSISPGGGAPAASSRSNSAIRTITGWRFTGASIRSAATGMCAPRQNGRVLRACSK